MHTHTPPEQLQSFTVKPVVHKCNPSIPLLSSVMWKIGLVICTSTSRAY